MQQQEKVTRSNLGTIAAAADVAAAAADVSAAAAGEYSSNRLLKVI